MSAKFINASEVNRIPFPGMGVLGAIAASTDTESHVFGDLEFAPGDGFNFHSHPNQEEVLYLFEGSLDAWIEGEQRTLKAGDTMFLPAGCVHACFNVSDAPAKMFVVLTPIVPSEELGFELVDHSGEEPYASYR